MIGDAAEVEGPEEHIASTATRAGLWQRFGAEAEALGSVVHHAADDGAAAELIGRAAPAPVGTGELAARFPAVAARCAPVAGSSAAMPDVVAAGVFAVAETGSVLVGEATGDRGACLLAERLWLLVRADEIVPTIDVAFERLGGLVRGGMRHAILMTGPSRSADIERTLTVGVHGPRELAIVVVGRDVGAASVPRRAP